MEGKELEQCLREFLSNFRLPGDGQKIDRIMEAFAQVYQAANPTVFRSVDTVHILVGIYHSLTSLQHDFIERL